jgi:hypothetical protein
MKNKFFIFALLSCPILFSGCYTHLEHARATDTGSGIRYYESSPYLLISSNSKGGLRWQILYITDTSKKMMVTPTVIWGHSELDLYFQNSMLTGSSELSDTTDLPKAVVAAVQSAIPLLAKGAFAVKPPQVPAPYIFKIVVDHDQVKFIGHQGDTSITVPLPKAS